MLKVSRPLLDTRSDVWNRRRLLRNSLLVAAASFGEPLVSLAQQPLGYGCCLPDKEFNQLRWRTDGLQRYEIGNEPMYKHSNDPEFDRALAEMLASISDVFDVLPAFVYYDDTTDGKNAYANQTVRMNRTDGTVAFGLGLLADKLARRSDGSHVAAVCAHEFGHIVQYKHGINLSDGEPTVKMQELHADFLAGYFAARHKEDRPNYPAAEFALSQYDGGDPATWNPNHHGTKKERGDAVVAGFNARKLDKLSFSEAIERGISYARSV